MPKDKESLLNEANLLSLRISEIYTNSLEIHKNLLKDGYYDASIESIFNRAYKFKVELEKIKEQLSLFQENNDIEDLATNDNDITRKDLDYYFASQSDYSDNSYQYESEDKNIELLENEDYQATDIESSQDIYEENQYDYFQEIDYETLAIEVSENLEEYEKDFEDKYLAELPQELNEQEFNWDNFDDFDELNDDFEDYEITKDGKLTREQRANQVAVEILKKYDWDDKYLGLLRETFEINHHPTSRAAIERQLKNGMLPEELELALFIRELWESNGHYCLSFFSIYDRKTQKTSSNIGWKYPLQIIRFFSYLPAQEEIQFFIERAYDDWSSSAKLCEEFQSFIVYLIYISEFKYNISKGHGFSLTYNEVFVTRALKSSYWYW